MNDEQMAARAVGWLVRLPLSGEREVAGLLGVDEHDARRMLHGLALRGWIDSVEPGSPELERRRRYFVAEAAIAAWCAAREVTVATLAERAPVGRNDLLRRLARAEITTAVNRLCAAVARDLRRVGLAELVDVRSLPLRGPAVARWWLHGIDGYGCLRSGDRYAPFLVAWDRAGAPHVHRRQRAARWCRESDAVRARWGETGLPPLLMVCPTLREVAVWQDALAGRPDAAATPPFAVLLTTARALREHGAAAPIWRSAAGDEGQLVEQVGWGPAPPLPAPPRFDGLDDLVTVDRRGQGTLRRWAAERATTEGSRARWQHAAALALATGPGEQTLLDWIARHPLLAASDLAELLREPAALVARRLEWLVRCRAVAPAPVP